MRPRIIFDTSAINALEDGGADSIPLMRRLAWDFEVVLTQINLEEILCTSCPERRADLLARFKRLLRHRKCIVTPLEIVQRMISTHLEDPTGFDWRRVDVGMPDQFYSMLERDEFDEVLSEAQRNQNRDIEKGFRAVLKSVRPPLDAMEPDERPTSFEDTLAQTNGFELRFAKDIYEDHSRQQMTEGQIEEFVRVCPPMNCAGLSQVMGFHRWSLRNRPSTKKDPGGRNDLLAASYLPFCDFFVTHDGSQHEELNEVARVARVGCQVQSFDEFKNTTTP
jgi:hypothetical protein